MESDAGVRKLVELILGKKPTISREMATQSFIPSILLNEDFSGRLTKVLDIRRGFLIERWKDYFDRNFRKMLISHMTYATFLITACLTENKCNENTFDSFIGVCLLLSHLGEETLSKVGVDFCDLIPDIFMVFYWKELKRPFQKHKGFNRLVEYIRDHKYHKWPNHSSASKEWHLELASYKASENISLDDVKEFQVIAVSMALDALSSTSVKLPDLPTEYELIQRLVDYRKREKEKEAEKKRKDETFLSLETSAGEASSNSDLGESQEKTAWHENIIKAVIRHNKSKYSGQGTANDQSYAEANRILEYLGSKIKSLIEVLDECYE